MKKVIALIRTSTDKQDRQEQTKEVVELILSEGYSIEDIEVVGDEEGASAIKVDEQYLKNLNKVYELIENGNIECVYVWAVDRIGRTRTHLTNFREFLLKHKVQLVIKNPSLRLLNPDGTENSGISLAFALFTELAVQEMEQKKARFHRGKKRNAESGKFNGGTVPFGYTLDENNFYIPHPEESEVVKLAFNLMSTGKYSTSTLTKELRERGIRFNGRLITYQYVVFMLKNTAYKGMRNKYAFNKIYPRLISNELFDVCQKILSSNNSSQPKTTKNYYFASLLIECPDCGRHYITHHNKYMCSSYNSPSIRKTMGQLPCANNIMVNVEQLDGLLWSIAVDIHYNYITTIDEKDKDEIRKQIEILLLKREELQRSISELSGKLERIQEIYIETGNKQLFTKNKLKIEEERKELNNSLIKNKEEEERLHTLLNEEVNVLDKWISDSFKGSESDNELLMYKLVHQYIKSVRIERNGVFEGVFTDDGVDMSKRNSLKLYITTIDNRTEEYYYILHYKKEPRKIFQMSDNILFHVDYEPIERTKTGIKTDIMKWVEMIGL